MAGLLSSRGRQPRHRSSKRLNREIGVFLQGEAIQKRLLSCGLATEEPARRIAPQNIFATSKAHGKDWQRNSISSRSSAMRRSYSGRYTDFLSAPQLARAALAIHLGDSHRSRSM